MKRTRYFHQFVLLALIVTALPCLAVGQDSFLIVKNAVVENNTQKSLGKAEILVYANGALHQTFTTDSAGRTTINLPLDHFYYFVYRQSGYFDKIIQINCTDIPWDKKDADFMLDLEIKLEERLEGFSSPLLQEPIAKAYYNALTDMLEFDYTYTAGYVDALQKEKSRFLALPTHE
jgi:hypothetical protein